MNVTVFIDKTCSLSVDLGKKQKKYSHLYLPASELFWGNRWALDTAEKDRFYSRVC